MLFRSVSQSRYASKVFWAGFQRIQPLVLSFFIILSVVLSVVCLVLGTKNISLQTMLLENREKKIEVIVNTQEIADALSKEYQKGVIEREIIYEKIKGDTQVITKQDTVFFNSCSSYGRGFTECCSCVATL